MPEERLGVISILRVFLRLGCTSFGGPVAHLGYFHDEFVARRRWITEKEYADLVALCQFLPGPASSQVGFAIGLKRGGLSGGVAAWLGFTFPSALLMTACAYGIVLVGGDVEPGWLAGLKLAAVAVVANAVIGMARCLCPDRPRATVAAVGCLIALLHQGLGGQLAVIAFGALAGLGFLRGAGGVPGGPSRIDHAPGPRVAAGFLAVYAGLLLLLPTWSAVHENQGLRYFESFYRSGALVFGGGHVLLPLLQGEVVAPGWIAENTFLAGYGAAQALPGPLFAFSAFLGASMQFPPNGLGGALLCICAIFLPSVLLLTGVLPYWDRLHRSAAVQQALPGANAAVVGLLAAALYHPVWTHAVHDAAGVAVAVTGFAMLRFWNLPSWAVVAACGIAGQFLLG